MTIAEAPIAQLARALEETGDIIARVRPEQSSLPTPCASYDVRALINHVVYDVRVFTSAVNGEALKSADADLIGDDWFGAYRAAADSLLAAWSRPNAFDGTLQLPFGEMPASWCIRQQISDMAVHSWDIARATGQPTDLDPEIGEIALIWSRENLHPQFRGQEGQAAFGPEVPVPATASLYDRLAGFFGRDPGR